MKKVILIVLSILTCFCMAIGLTACKKDGQSTTPTIEIGSDGYWYINGTKTDYKANGEQGEQGEQGKQGEKGSDGINGSNGVDGKDGKDGKDGVDGKSPVITIGENGNWFIDGVDTNVKAQGEKGDKGDAGENGSDGKDGENGSDGKDGKSAYEIFKEKYGYEGTEEQWLDDLVNGRLALKDKYTVTFDSDGGSEIKSQEVADGKKANEPDAPTKTGYTFDGWFVKTTEWNFLAYTVTENVTLKAKWVANEYTLQFNSNGGNEIADMTVTYDGDYILPEPTKENYVFLGWKEDETVCEQSGKWQKTSGATLTAEWVIAKSTITFETNGGSVVAPMTINYGENYTLPMSTRENYALVGWFLGDMKFESGTPLTGDITLSAKWQGVTDTFEYTEEGGEITLTKFKGGVTDVIIPANINGVTVAKLADGIFRDNTEITSVTFDGSFENYDSKLFQGCTSLRSLVISGVYDKELYYLFGDSIDEIPESFVEITFAENSIYVDGTMFKNKVAKHIVTYVIPDGTTEIKASQFEGWRYMRAVYIPDSVTNIGYDAFKYCSGLTNLTIPANIERVVNAFYGCDFIKCLYYSGDMLSWCKIKQLSLPMCARQLFINEKEVVGDIIIPNGVTSIGSNIFSGCVGITSISMPDSVTRIGSGAFNGCSGLTRVSISDNITNIGEDAFGGCDKIIKKSKDIYYVDKWVVGVSNNSIKNAIIEKGTIGFADKVFSSCESINLYYMGDLRSWCKIKGDIFGLMYHFSRIAGLYIDGKEISGDLMIPEGVTEIGSSTFACRGISSITFPSSLTKIGNCAFWHSRIKSIEFKGTKDQWKAISKGSGWNEADDEVDYNYIVHCEDGDIEEKTNYYSR